MPTKGKFDPEKEVKSLRYELTRLQAEIDAIRQQNVAPVSEKKDTDNQGVATSRVVVIENTPSNREPSQKPPDENKHKLNKTLKTVGTLAGIGYAVITLLMWIDSNKNFRADQRAWLSPSGLRVMTPYNAAHVGIVIDLFNSGKTPAQIDKESTLIGLDRGKGQINWFTTTVGDEDSVAPNRANPVTIRTNLPISDDEFKNIIDMKMAVDFKTTISYHDVFGDPHTTEVCIQVMGPQENFVKGQVLPSCGVAKMD